MGKGHLRLGRNAQKQHCWRFAYRLPTVRYSRPNLYPIQRGSNTVAAVFSVLIFEDGTGGRVLILTGQRIYKRRFRRGHSSKMAHNPCL